MTYLDEHATSLAEDVAPFVQHADGQTSLPAPAVAAIRRSGVLRLLVPSCLGGAGGDWPAALQAVDAVARVDGSAAWCLMIGMVGNMVAGYVPRQVAEVMYASPDVFTAGVFEPRGVATREGAGHVVRGRWRFASGIHHSDWCCLGALVKGGDGPEIRQFVFRLDDVQIHENWNTLGLVATGSHDVQVAGRAVAEPWTFTFDDTPWPDDPLWRVPFFSVAAALMSTTVLGVTRAALDATMPTVEGLARVVEVPAAQARLTDHVERVWGRATAGDPPTLDDRAALWRAAIEATRSCRWALADAFVACGAAAIRKGHPIERALRDVWTAGQHVLVAERQLESISRKLAGEPVNTSPFL